MTVEKGTTPVQIAIRRAAPMDFVNIARLLEQAVQDVEVAFPPINQMKLLQWIMDCKRDGEIVVADCSRQIVGALGLLAREYPWADERMIASEFFYVQPKFRKRGTADSLIQAAEKFADDSKTRLVMTFVGGKDAELKDVYMSRKRFIYCGGTFLRMPAT